MSRYQPRPRRSILQSSRLQSQWDFGYGVAGIIRHAAEQNVDDDQARLRLSLVTRNAQQLDLAMSVFRKARTNADKRRAVKTLLADAEWAKWSDREVARKACVSANFVGDMRRAICNPIADRTVSRNGTTYELNTANIGGGMRTLASEGDR